MDDKKKTGPEWAPLREFNKSFKIRVDIYDKDDNIIRTEVMDYGNKDDRIWLGKLSWWAWQNGHTCETAKE